ncbi:HNH endonuclease [Rhodobacteraceae bacterium R_SAG9]|nr:HNH endonuclease [Rhodobacteraceae bacterium R_SAG9]
MNYHKPKVPTDDQLATIRERFEIKDGKVVARIKYVRGPAVGEPVGSTGSHGYKAVRAANSSYLLHHISWFLSRGEWPTGTVDHKDGDRQNNCPDNLRMGSQGDNTRGFKTARKGRNASYRGIYETRFGKWRANLHVNRKRYNAGNWETAEEAAIAWDYAAASIGYKIEALNLKTVPALRSIVPKARRIEIGDVVTAGLRAKGLQLL